MLLRNFLNDFKIVKCAVVLLVSLLFVDAFAKLRKATIIFVVSVCPSVRLYLRPHCTPRPPLHGFSLNLIFDILVGILHKDVCTFMITSGLILLKIEMFQRKFVENIKPHILCTVTFFPKIFPYIR